jgi:aminopeptidase-like protein
MEKFMIGNEMYNLAKMLFPINRSLTGKGVVKTLEILKEYNSDLQIHSISSGTKVFDWEVPDEWNCEEAYIITPDGKKICDYNKNNLHLVQYSIPVEKEISLEELQKHLYSLPHLPDAIPYVTSYYNRKWGFCISENERKKLKKGTYKIVIKSELKKGLLHYADIIIPGKSKKEIFFSTYICHPSMANNELSGPVLSIFLSKYLKKKENYYTYRFVFAPETIGSLVYIHDKLDYLKEHVKAGFILTCVGDERDYSYLESRYANTLADKVAQNILKYKIKNYKHYSFLERGSDERQYCAPGIDLPVCSVMKSKYATYPEYHTSLDDLNLITPKGLQESFNLYKDIIEVLENNFYYQVTVLGEPQLGKRGLYPKECTPTTNYNQAFLYRNILAYADGKNDLIDIANILKVDAVSLIPIIKLFLKHKLLKIIN